MEEVKTLPMRMPPCETYQGMAFIMGVLLSHENIKNYFHNTYISLRCANSDKMNGATVKSPLEFLYMIMYHFLESIL